MLLLLLLRGVDVVLHLLPTDDSGGGGGDDVIAGSGVEALDVTDEVVAVAVAAAKVHSDDAMLIAASGSSCNRALSSLASTLTPRL